jgi:predicted esterase
MRHLSLAVSAVLLSSIWACGSDDPADSPAASGAGASSSGSNSGASSSGAGASGGEATGASGPTSGPGGSGGSGSGGSPPLLGCGSEPPPGAPLAAAPKPYAGTCPEIPLVSTQQDIVIESSGNQRAFWVVVPENLQPDEKLPVMFLWHWLGGDAADFYERGEVQAATTEQRFIAVIPQKKGDLQFTWPYTNIDTQPRLDEELAFFDDMLSCVSAAFDVDSNCVSTVGVSAGALWSSQLVGQRDEYLSSFMSLSGGTGGLLIKPFTPPTHKMPAFVLWGGPTDNCFGVMNFVETSGDLETQLDAGGHFFLECIHNCGHSVPPFEPPAGSSKFKALWQFALDHPFWYGPGDSPYNTDLPGDLPEWCAIGKGSATPRVGECTEEPGC